MTGGKFRFRWAFKCALFKSLESLLVLSLAGTFFARATISMAEFSTGERAKASVGYRVVFLKSGSASQKTQVRRGCRTLKDDDHEAKSQDELAVSLAYPTPNIMSPLE